MKIYDFVPNFRVVDNVIGDWSIAALEQERGVYSATPAFVHQNCGELARALLCRVPDAYFAECERLKLYPNCDVRIHRLYPGDFPAYPGWHCDGEFRETYFSQPDLDRIKVSRHMTATLSSHSSGVSSPQFLAESFSCAIEEASDVALWGQVDAKLRKRQPKLVHDTTDGQLIEFDSWTLHRAMPAKIRGWRLFFRISMWHRPNLGAGGMLTKQEQVYKLAEGSGW